MAVPSDEGAFVPKTPPLPTARSVALFALLLIFLSATVPSPRVAQASSEISSRGTEFWFAFPTNNNPSSAQPRLFIAAEQATSGTVTIAATDTSEAFTIAAGGLVSIDLPHQAQVTEVNGTSAGKGVRVIADAPVTVYGLNLQTSTTDAFLAIPSAALGTEHRALAAPTTLPSNPGGFSVIGTQDATQVTITPSINARSRTAGVAFTVVLNAGDVFQLATNETAGDDLSGSLIESDKPVAVMGYVRCVHIPDATVTACDHIVQQLPSVDNWGTSFAVPKLEPRSRYTLRVLAGRDGTEVRIDGTLVATLDAGGIYTAIQTSAVLVTTSRPTLVAQYAHGINDDSGASRTGDPFMMLIPSVEQFLTAYTIATAGTNFTTHYVNLVTTTAGIAGITQGGVAVPDSDFSEIGGAGSGLWGATISIGNGTHRFEGAEPFGVFTYGWTNADSYGYPGGTAFRSGVGTVTSLSVAPSTAAVQVGTEVCIEASLGGPAGVDLEGVRVDWTVTGANPKSAQITSDADGKATFCSTPDAAGSDTVTAAAAGLSASATVTVTTDPPPEDPPGPEGAPTPSAEEQSVALAVEQAVGLTGTAGLIVRRDTVVPLQSTISPAVGPRGGLVLEDEDGTLKVTISTVAGVSPTAGVVVPVDGEIICEICARLAADSVVEGWILSEPRLAGAVRVEADDDCPLFRIPVGAPLDGAGAIGSGVHTLQLRLYTEIGYEVLAVRVTIGGPVPTSVPSGEGPSAPFGIALLLAGLVGIATATAQRRSRKPGPGTEAV